MATFEQLQSQLAQLHIPYPWGQHRTVGILPMLALLLGRPRPLPTWPYSSTV